MKTELLSIDDLTRMAKNAVHAGDRELALREIARRDNHVYNPETKRFRRPLRIRDYGLSPSL